MLLQLPFDPDLSRWETWVALIASLCCAVLLLLVGIGPFLRDQPDAARGNISLFGGIRTFLQERRNSRRQSTGTVRVGLRDAESEAALGEAELLDRTLEGLCLKVAHQLEAGRALRVRKLGAGGSRPWVRVNVKYCRQLPGNGWAVGCEIVQGQSGCSGLLFG